MSEALGFWRRLPGRARGGLVTGAVLIVALTVLLGWWLLRIDYQVLFTDLKPQDAQAMTAELERLKIPYRLGDAGTSILVDGRTVHATRIKLLGRDVPLHGSVGLELFNNNDFGMTEFTQKVNFQRALQGEITRTIQSLAEIRDVRVLLAMPEQGLFKQATARPKASISLSLRPGRTLRPEQIVGIQRLVAAAVPGMAIQDVTLVDDSGVALTRADAGEGGTAGMGGRLDLKRDTEAYLQRKVAEVLDRSFGPGQALGSVDVTLSMDQVRTTTEDVLPAPVRGGLQSTGVIVREKEVLRDAAGAPQRAVDSTQRGSGSQRDTEYAVGRRVEQIVGQPGAIRRIHVVAVLRRALDAAEEDKLRAVLAAAVGASLERGDSVVVQTLGASGAGTQASPSAASLQPNGAGGPPLRPAADAAAAPPAWSVALPPWLGPAVVALVAVLALLWLRIRRRDRERPVAPASPRTLSDEERAAALARVRAWLDADEATRPGSVASPADLGVRP
ncbi:flagellar basal-body MS-ring/collar protein FliF [Xenophilus sp.]|uniref:flagellar basal-body MS-ring/collar protein FliF n=1 Tax=Xenophilus sp. TaxID=1873499 RepID=UPI0037DD07FA